MLLAILLTSLCALRSSAAGGDQDHSTVVHPLVWELLEAEREPVAVWVFFADKGLNSKQQREAAARAEAELKPRAIERRRSRRTLSGLADMNDVPVRAAYIEDVTATGACLRVTSRWLNAVSVSANAEQIHALAALPFVKSIEPVRRGVRAEAVPIESLQSIAAGQRQARGGFYGLSEEQLMQIGVTDMHAAGYTGSGVIIGVLDTGFTLTHQAYNHPDQPINVIAEYDFLNDDPSVGIDPNDPLDQHFHGTVVLGTIAAYLPAELVGGAYEASFILAKTEDTTDEYQAEEDYYAAGLEFIEANGADVATSSLGYIAWYDWFDLDGLTAVTTIAVNMATANGLACCTAAGNGGQDQDLPSLVAPGDAFDVITCGSVSAAGDLSDFSSIGPTVDGRTKPEVLARGEQTASVDAFDDTMFTTANGTSLSTPLVASAVALLIQAHPNWTIAQIRTALFETASYYVANGQPDPASHQGYGIINVFAASQMVFCGPSNLNDDDAVNAADLALLLGAWGANPGHPADLNNDGVVNASDLALLLGSWGPCS